MGQDQAFGARAFGRHCKSTPEPRGSSHRGSSDSSQVPLSFPQLLFLRTKTMASAGV